MMVAHVDAYFKYVHPVQANGFLHRDTVYQLLESGRIDRKVLLAICAISTPFLQIDPSYATALDPGAWAREAKTRLILDAEMTLDSLATALILAKYDIHNGRYASAWLLASMANRTALSLGLHKESSEDMPSSIAEFRRRLYWGCFCLDRMMSTGIVEFVTTQADRVSLKLPCDENHFNLGIPVEAPFADFTSLIPRADPDFTVGILGHYVIISGFRYEIRK